MDKISANEKWLLEFFLILFFLYLSILVLGKELVPAFLNNRMELKAALVKMENSSQKNELFAQTEFQEMQPINIIQVVDLLEKSGLTVNKLEKENEQNLKAFFSYSINASGNIKSMLNWQKNIEKLKFLGCSNMKIMAEKDNFKFTGKLNFW
ncbi:MAG: hypothetical protein WCI30_01275 [Clostridia bacterium]